MLSGSYLQTWASWRMCTMLWKSQAQALQQRVRAPLSAVLKRLCAPDAATTAAAADPALLDSKKSYANQRKLSTCTTTDGTTTNTSVSANQR